MENNRIGSFIAQSRREKGLTQQELADELNITNKAISKWETGNGLPDITLLMKLAKVLDVTVEEILAGERDTKEESSNLFLNDQDNQEATESFKSARQTNDVAHEVTGYLVNKSIERFKLMSVLCIVMSVVGIIIPFFIWPETHDITGFLFGCWFEICSGGILTYYYRIMKNEISSYNRTATEKLIPENILIRYLRILGIMWIISFLLLIGALVF